MAETNGLMENINSKNARLPTEREHGIVESVYLRINTVDESELKKLSMVVDALRNSQFNDDLVDDGDGNRDFVVTVKPATINEIKDALHLILKVVAGDRVLIET